MLNFSKYFFQLIPILDFFGVVSFHSFNFASASREVRSRSYRSEYQNQVNEMPLCPQFMIEPFEKWAIYFVGPIAPTSLNKRHIFVCTDFVTKWVEAKVVSFAIAKVVDFLFNAIFTRFGVPREIVTNNGLQFISNLVKGIMEQYKIRHKKSTPYHPHENDQVESTNKVIKSILIKIVNLHKKDWASRLPEALWAYITTWRNITGHTPYELVHGK